MMGWMAPLRHLSAKLLSDRISSEWEPSMGEVTTIGLDLAKHVFQVHGVGGTVLRKQLRRAQVLAFFSRLPPCLVGLKARARRRTTGRGSCARLATRCADAGAIREGVHQAQQARCRRCGSNLRGGWAPDDALCAGQDG